MTSSHAGRAAPVAKAGEDWLFRPHPLKPPRNFGVPKRTSQENAMRPSRRQPDELRAVSLERGVVKYAEGSCFVKCAATHVLVPATREERLPPWLKGQGRGSRSSSVAVTST